jgi:rod shape-determining protein MreB and related proteins
LGAGCLWENNFKKTGIIQPVLLSVFTRIADVVCASHIKETDLAFNPLNWLLGLFSLDIGIDLGTANTMVNVRGKGIVISEPSVVAIDKRTREPLKIGAEAKEMIGRTPANVIAVRPLRDGVISEFEITQAMLEYFIGKVHQQTIVPVPRPRVVVGIPAGVTKVEKRAVYDAALSAGAREVYLIEEPVAAALGAGLPINEVRGSMVVDIGGGTSEVAILSMKGVVVSRSLRVAGDELDEDVIQYIRNKYNLLIGPRMAEQAKITIGSAYHLPQEKTMTLRGRNLITGLPEAIEVSSVELREAMSNSVQTIVEVIKDALDEAPPEIIADLMDTGICMAGGGSLLQGLSERLSSELNIRSWVAEDPMSCVARGAGISLENMDMWRSLYVGLGRNDTGPR